MFGVSGVYHRVTWSPRVAPADAAARPRRRLLLIAGSYTPLGLLILDGNWRLVVLSVVWGGAALAIVVKFVWVDAPKWLAAAIAITLGWVAVLVMPQVADTRRAHRLRCCSWPAGSRTPSAGSSTRPSAPTRCPAVFGYHEVFHVLVILAVACSGRRSRSSSCRTPDCQTGATVRIGQASRGLAAAAGGNPGRRRPGRVARAKIESSEMRIVRRILLLSGGRSGDGSPVRSSVDRGPGLSSPNRNVAGTQMPPVTLVRDERIQGRADCRTPLRKLRLRLDSHGPGGGGTTTQAARLRQ